MKLVDFSKVLYRTLNIIFLAVMSIQFGVSMKVQMAAMQQRDHAIQPLVSGHMRENFH